MILVSPHYRAQLPAESCQCQCLRTTHEIYLQIISKFTMAQ